MLSPLTDPAPPIVFARVRPVDGERDEGGIGPVADKVVDAGASPAADRKGDPPAIRSRASVGTFNVVLERASEAAARRGGSIGSPPTPIYAGQSLETKKARRM